MKTALATVVIALVSPIAVTAIPGGPDYVMSDVTDNCLDDVAENDQATESDENCIEQEG